MGFRAYGLVWGAASSVLAVVMVVAAPAQAAELSAWSYDEAEQQLEFSLPQSVLPRFFLLAEPTRIVLDIPTTQLGAVPMEQHYGGAITRIRVSQFEGETVRMVIDLAPGTVLQERQAEIEFDDGLNGQRRWRFRPRVDLAATQVTNNRQAADHRQAADNRQPADVARTVAPPLDVDAVNAAPHPSVPVPSPEAQAAPTAAQPTSTPLADIPISLENAEEISYSAAGLRLPETPLVDVSTLPVDLYAESNRATTADTVTVPPLESVAAQPVTPEPGSVPPMVAPELEAVAPVDGGAVEPVPPPFVTAPVASEAEQYTAAIAPPSPGDMPPTPLEVANTPPIPVIEMSSERAPRTITQTAAPAVVQFGQPLPSP